MYNEESRKIIDSWEPIAKRHVADALATPTSQKTLEEFFKPDVLQTINKLYYRAQNNVTFALATPTSQKTLEEFFKPDVLQTIQHWNPRAQEDLTFALARPTSQRMLLEFFKPEILQTIKNWSLDTRGGVTVALAKPESQSALAELFSNDKFATLEWDYANQKKAVDALQKGFIDKNFQYLNFDKHFQNLENKYTGDPEALLTAILEVPETENRRAKLLQKSGVIKNWLQLGKAKTRDQENSPRGEHWQQFIANVGDDRNAKKLQAAAQIQLDAWNSNFDTILGEHTFSAEDQGALVLARKGEERLPLTKNIPPGLWQYLPHLTEVQLSDLRGALNDPITSKAFFDGIGQLKGLKILGLENAGIANVTELQGLLNTLPLQELKLRGNPLPIAWREQVQEQRPGQVSFSENIQDDFEGTLKEYKEGGSPEYKAAREALVGRLTKYWDKLTNATTGTLPFEANGVQVDQFPDNFPGMVASEKLKSVHLNNALAKPSKEEQRSFDFAAFRDATRLTEMNLDGNYFTDATNLDALHELQRLKSVSLKQNAFRELPEGVAKVPDSCTVDMTENPLSHGASIDARLTNLLHGGKNIATKVLTNNVSDTSTTSKLSYNIPLDAFDALEEESQEIQDVHKRVAGIDRKLERLQGDENFPSDKLKKLQDRVANIKTERGQEFIKQYANQSKVNALIELIGSNPRLLRYFTRHHLTTTALHNSAVDLHSVPDQADVKMEIDPALKNRSYAVQVVSGAVGLLPIPPTVSKVVGDVLKVATKTVGTGGPIVMQFLSDDAVKQRRHRLASVTPTMDLPAYCLSHSLSATMARAPQLLQPGKVDPGKDRTTDILKQAKEGLKSGTTLLGKKIEQSEPTSSAGKFAKEKAMGLLASDEDREEELLAQRDASCAVDIADGKPFGLDPDKPGFAESMRKIPTETKLLRGFEWFCKADNNPNGVELPYKKHLVFNVTPDHKKWGSTIRSVMMGDLDAVDDLVKGEKKNAKLREKLKTAYEKINDANDRTQNERASRRNLTKTLRLMPGFEHLPLSDSENEQAPSPLRVSDSESSEDEQALPIRFSDSENEQAPFLRRSVAKGKNVDHSMRDEERVEEPRSMDDVKTRNEQSLAEGLRRSRLPVVPGESSKNSNNFAGAGR